MASATAAPDAAPDQTTSFANRRAALCDEFQALWAATPVEMPALGPRAGLLRQRRNARAAARLIDELAANIERFPEGESARRAWREAVRERLQRFGQERLGWPDGYRRLLFGDAFYESSVTFAREARAFNPALTLEPLGQALRNVWIGNSLQMLLDRPVELRGGLFAYSMLYPVTDNWLDDPGVAKHLKRAFNEQFGRRLAGLPARAADERLAAVSRLVERIEREFPRGECPLVYASLLAIHDAQVSSLHQHDDRCLTDGELTSISFNKGGSSVSADLYLVTREVSPADERFAFGYGVFLQLLDDLQDVEVDRAARHQTLFTCAARRGPLDALATRLACFIDTVLSAERFAAPEFADRIDLIRRNCRALLVGSVAEHPARFTSRFRRHLERQWPVTFRAQLRLRRRAMRCWSEVRSRVDVNARLADLLDRQHDRTVPVNG